MPVVSPLRRLAPALAGASMLALAACGGSGPKLAALDQPNDPLEGVNRVTHAVNDAVDQVVVRPLAIGYREAVPDNVQDRVRDFLTHIATPVTLLNDLLQGELDRAERTVARFFINTVIGFGGVADVAGAHGLPGHREDFGQTLAVWGVTEGPYLVLPLLGPSNFRDTVGLAVDTATDPLTWLLGRKDHWDVDWRPAGYARRGLAVVDGRMRILRATDDLRANSADYYVALRSSYRQRRNVEILNDRPAPGGVSAPGLSELVTTPAPR